MFKFFKKRINESKSTLLDFPQDILDKIESDFKQDADKATIAISKAIAEFDYLHSNRIIRCVIHLADGNILELGKSLRNASEDPRDVMFWAEYINFDNEDPDRIRDFNKPFGKENIV